MRPWFNRARSAAGTRFFATPYAPFRLGPFGFYGYRAAAVTRGRVRLDLEITTR